MRIARELECWSPHMNYGVGSPSSVASCGCEMAPAVLLKLPGAGRGAVQ